MRVIPFFLLAVLFAIPAAAQEQNPLSLTVGDQIRLPEPALSAAEGYVATATDAGAGWVNGQVTTFDSNGFSFRVQGDSRVHTRPYEVVEVIDVKRRMRTQSVRSSAKWGLYLGTALGAIAGPLAAKSLPMETSTSIAAFGAVGGVGGAALGAALGAVFNPSKWYRHVLR